MKNNFLMICTLLLGFMLTVSSCSEDPVATVSFNEVGDTLGGDVNGDGGNTIQTYTWNNPLTR